MNAARISLSVILLVTAAGIFSQWVAVHPHNLPSGNALEAPGPDHWLGTDDLGIDLWAQICHGAGVSVLVGVSAALLAGIGGCLIGMLAGYLGGITDRITMRMTDMMIILPDLPAMIVLGAFFGPGLINIILVLALFSWTGPARIIRSRILSMKQEQYIAAAQSYGAGFVHLAKTHFIPGVLPIALASIIRLTGRAIVAEASLSFLGLGDPTSKSWGLILNHAINFKGIYFMDCWKWWITSPLVAIIILVGAFAILARESETSAVSAFQK
ncbi:MAG: ABC transporter permease [Desulfatirhabdiaceae bacterium]